MENKPKTKKIILISLGLTSLSILGYFAWQKFFGKKSSNNSNSPAFDDIDSPLPSDFKSDNTSSYKPPKVVTPKTETKSSFPLKKGSKGDLVKALQNALISKYGKAIMPKYGADGYFGSELATALKNKNLPATIDESTYNVLTNGYNAETDFKKLANAIFKAANKRDFNATIKELKQLKSVSDYTKTNIHFKEMRLFGGVRQTLVNGLLNAFTSESQKESIRLAFLSMGLKYNGTKWSLEGLNGLQIITTTPTLVWKDQSTAIEVPANMILGTEISTRNQYTMFENNRMYFLVKSSAIKPY